jgi:hypothetical protein
LAGLAPLIHGYFDLVHTIPLVSVRVPVDGAVERLAAATRVNGPMSFSTPDRRQVEKRLKKYGVRPVEIEELFQGEAEHGEGVITVRMWGE